MKKGESDFFEVMKPSMWVDETDFESTKMGWIQKKGSTPNPRREHGAMHLI